LSSMAVEKRGKVVDVTDDSVIAAMLQKDEEQYGDYEHVPKPQVVTRKILTDNDAPAVDFIAQNCQTLINSINQHYWDELFSFSKVSDDLDDDDVVRMISCDKSGFQVSIAPKKHRGKTVHTQVRRVNFNDDVYTEKEFMDEFFEAVGDADRDVDYDRVTKLTSGLNTTVKTKLGVGKDFAVRNDKKPRHPPKRQPKSRDDNEVGPVEELLMANKDAAKGIMYLKGALLADFCVNPDSRTEQLLKMNKHERLTLPVLCKKAYHKFRMKGLNQLIAIYDHTGQEIRSKTSLSTLKTGDLLFFSTKRGQEKQLQESLETKKSAVAQRATGNAAEHETAGKDAQTTVGDAQDTVEDAQESEVEDDSQDAEEVQVDSSV